MFLILLIWRLNPVCYCLMSKQYLDCDLLNKWKEPLLLMAAETQPILGRDAFDLLGRGKCNPWIQMLTNFVFQYFVSHLICR